MRPSFFTLKPFSTYTFGWVAMQVNVENTFNNIFQIVIKRSMKCQGTFGKHWTLYQIVLWCSFFSLLPTWATWKGITTVESSLSTRQGDPLSGIFFCFRTFLETIMWTLNYVFPSLANNTHIMGPINEVILAFDHLSTQLALVGFKVKVSKCKL